MVGRTRPRPGPREGQLLTRWPAWKKAGDARGQVTGRPVSSSSAKALPGVLRVLPRGEDPTVGSETERSGACLVPGLIHARPWIQPAPREDFIPATVYGGSSQRCDQGSKTLRTGVTHIATDCGEKCWCREGLRAALGNEVRCGQAELSVRATGRYRWRVPTEPRLTCISRRDCRHMGKLSMSFI